MLACTPRKERVIYHQLRAKGFEVYYPYQITRTKDPNTLKMEPHFPGYVFVKVDLSKIALSTFQGMPMTSGLICVAGKPAIVPEPMIMAIHRMLKKANSSVLGTPEEFENADAYRSAAEGYSGNGNWLDMNASVGDRNRFLLQVLNNLASGNEE